MGKKKRSKNVSASGDDVAGDRRVNTAELIESCRAHLASMTLLVGVTSQMLHQAYGYEAQEPNLGECCDAVSLLLMPAEQLMSALGVVYANEDPVAHAKRLEEACPLLARSLRPCIHVVRAITAVLKSASLEQARETLEALHDLENGLSSVLNGIDYIATSPGSGAR